MFKVRLYKTKDGYSPIKDFIFSSPKSLQNKIARQINYLIEFGLTIANPSLKKISGTKL